MWYSLLITTHPIEVYSFRHINKDVRIMLEAQVRLYQLFKCHRSCVYQFIQLHFISWCFTVFYNKWKMKYFHFKFYCFCQLTGWLAKNVFKNCYIYCCQEFNNMLHFNSMIFIWLNIQCNTDDLKKRKDKTKEIHIQHYV